MLGINSQLCRPLCVTSPYIFRSGHPLLPRSARSLHVCRSSQTSATQMVLKNDEKWIIPLKKLGSAVDSHFFHFLSVVTSLNKANPNVALVLSLIYTALKYLENHGYPLKKLIGGSGGGGSGGGGSGGGGSGGGSSSASFTFYGNNKKVVIRFPIEQMIVSDE